MRYILVVLSLLMSSFYVASQNVDVIAIEYPPYTSQTEPHYGLSFYALTQHFKQQKITFTPLFLPPARAAYHLKSTKWCLSFYPPLEQNTYPEIVLNEHVVKLGLYRKAKATPFTWESLNELSGKKIAMLRSNNRLSELMNQFINANIEQIFVESVAQGLMLLDKDRVDYAFSDLAGGNYNIKQLGLNHNDFQFSSSYLLETKIKVWRNPNCNIIEPN